MKPSPFLVVLAAVAAMLVLLGAYRSRQAGGVVPPDPVPTTNGVSAVPAPDTGRAAAGASVARGADDPLMAEALRLAGLPESMARQDEISAFARGLNDPSLCAAIATNLTRYGHALSGAALRRWVELDAPGVIRGYALATPQRDLRAANLEWTFRDYAAQDPVAALTLARSLPGLGQTERDRSVAAVLPALARIDPAGAAAELAKLPASIGASPAYEVYAGLAQTQSADTLFADAERLPGVARSSARQAVIKAAAQSDRAEAVRLWTAGGQSGMKHDLTRALFDGFRDAAVDPGVLARWFLTYAAEPGAESVRNEALSRYAEVDAAGARQVIAERPVFERDALNTAMADMLDPGAGLEFARQVTQVEDRRSALASVAQRLAVTDPETLLREVGTDVELAQVAQPAVVEALVYQDADRAAEYVRGLSADLRGEAAVALADRLADTHPGQAMSVAAELIDDPEQRDLAVARGYAAAIRTAGDARAALPSLPSGVDGDAVRGAAVSLLAYTHPDQALAIAQGIADGGQRANALHEALQGLARRASVADAQQILAGLGLDEAVTEQIRRQLSVGP